VELMTSGAFAQASGLSRKALRLYDELGLLHPARVDPETLYRFYHQDQLGQARLVAWLRRLGMPLAAIRAVSGLPPAQAAEELAAYWAKVEAETAARRELAVFLIGYLSGKDTAMSDGQGTLTVRYGVRSDIGLIREGNEDAAYAGARLLAVADGMGGHAAGEVASAAVIEALRPLDTQVPATQDHTLVQSLLDDGKITTEEVASHPQRMLLLRALTGNHSSRPDLQLRQARPGDRYLLCSDGLHVVVPADAIARVLLTEADPDQAARDLLALALDGGAPDNITCIVADVDG